MRYKKKLPVGVDSFSKLIRQNFYYIDKTDLLMNLLNNWAEVNLFTRPRRFGKSLNMSMMQTFFEIGCEQADAVSGLMEAAGFKEITIKKDYCGRNRIVFGLQTEMVR